MSALPLPSPENIHGRPNASGNLTSRSPSSLTSPYGGTGKSAYNRWSPQSSPTAAHLSEDARKMLDQYKAAKATTPTRSPSPKSYGIRVETSTTTSAKSGQNKETIQAFASEKHTLSPAALRFQMATQKAIEEKRLERETERNLSMGTRDEVSDVAGGEAKSISASTISTHMSARNTSPAAPTPPRYPHYATRDFPKQSPSLADNSDNESINSNSSQVSRRSLDLMKNDNAFYVIANLLIERFAACVQNYGDTFLMLDAENVAKLDKMVPIEVRKSFTKALRYRLVKNCPPDSEEQVHILTRQCREFGLDRQGMDNPLLGMKVGYPLTVTVSPLYLLLTISLCVFIYTSSYPFFCTFVFYRRICLRLQLLADHIVYQV